MADPIDALRDLYVAARGYVRAYARAGAPHVAPDYVDAVVAAVGDISVFEATAVIDREEARVSGGAR